MDVFSALQTSVSGLKAQAFSLENISGNIANSQTVGYKRIDTDFVDMLAERSAKQQTAGSVAAFSQLTNSLQGGVAATGIATNMALSGDGFFTVKTKAGDTGSAPVFSGTDVYTRRGDFAVDRNGYLVNGAGSYLVGKNLGSGAAGAGVIKISDAPLDPRPTTSLTYAANLPSTPSTVSGSGLLGALPGGDTRVLTGTAATPPSVAAADTPAFLDASLSGGDLTAYSETGAPVSLQLRWAKVAGADAAAGTSDTWNLFYSGQTGDAQGAATWRNIGAAFTFNGSGQLTAPTGTALNIPAMTVGGTSLGAIALNLGTGGLTQYSASSGQVATETLQQNGYAGGSLTSVAVTNEGKVTGTYSNGRSVALAEVGVVRFDAPNALKAVSAGNYAQTVESGEPQGQPDPNKVLPDGTTIIGGNVEQSNTDTAGEFSKLIVTQQAYSANTRVMSTAQQMMSDLINVIR